MGRGAGTSEQTVTSTPSRSGKTVLDQLFNGSVTIQELGFNVETSCKAIDDRCQDAVIKAITEQGEAGPTGETTPWKAVWYQQEGSDEVKPLGDFYFYQTYTPAS